MVLRQHTNVDANLVNPWGLAFGPEFAWVGDNGAGVATLYDGKGTPQILVVGIPPVGDETTATPTGVVYNRTKDFVVTSGTLKGPSRFLFATEGGEIAGWSPEVSANQAILAVNRSSAMNVYKGIAIASRVIKTNKSHRSAPSKKISNFLYATDFRHAKIDVFDGSFTQVTVPGGFFDKSIPDGFAPFGIRNIDDLLYVTYAKQDDAKHDDVKGPGLGFVRIFTPDGVLVRRLISRGALNAPWGLAEAPHDFGKFNNELLVGNFGDGVINVYHIPNGRFDGQLRDADKKIITIEGLWGLDFGNGAPTQPRNALFFTAGPNGENNGLFGRIDMGSSRKLPSCRPHWK